MLRRWLLTLFALWACSPAVGAESCAERPPGAATVVARADANEALRVWVTSGDGAHQATLVPRSGPALRGYAGWGDADAASYPAAGTGAAGSDGAAAGAASILARAVQYSADGLAERVYLVDSDGLLWRAELSPWRAGALSLTAVARLSLAPGGRVRQLILLRARGSDSAIHTGIVILLEHRRSGGRSLELVYLRDLASPASARKVKPLDAAELPEVASCHPAAACEQAAHSSGWRRVWFGVEAGLETLAEVRGGRVAMLRPARQSACAHELVREIELATGAEVAPRTFGAVPTAVGPDEEAGFFRLYGGEIPQGSRARLRVLAWRDLLLDVN